MERQARGVVVPEDAQAAASRPERSGDCGRHEGAEEHGGQALGARVNT